YYSHSLLRVPVPGLTFHESESSAATMSTRFEFSAGVWNLHPGADPFGPPVRPERGFAEKCRILKRLGFTYVQLHDDDAGPMEVPAGQPGPARQALKPICDDNGLGVEFVAPRILEDPALCRR